MEVRLERCLTVLTLGKQVESVEPNRLMRRVWKWAKVIKPANLINEPRKNIRGGAFKMCEFSLKSKLTRNWNEMNGAWEKQTLHGTQSNRK